MLCWIIRENISIELHKKFPTAYYSKLDTRLIFIKTVINNVLIKEFSMLLKIAFTNYRQRDMVDSQDIRAFFLEF